MTKEKIYTYLGVNGTITSPVYLEGIYSVHKIQLIADQGKRLTNGKQFVSSIIIPENEENEWTEVLGED